jgi:hypothetical protein
METLRLFIILAWIALPTVMFGGYSLLRLLIQGDRLTPFQVSQFRAGHAHAGVLLIMSLAYYVFMDQTALADGIKVVAAAAVFVGILAQSGGFFLHMVIGKPNAPSLGTSLTVIGALLLTVAIVALVIGLVTAP